MGGSYQQQSGSTTRTVLSAFCAALFLTISPTSSLVVPPCVTTAPRRTLLPSANAAHATPIPRCEHIFRYGTAARNPYGNNRGAQSSLSRPMFSNWTERRYGGRSLIIAAAGGRAESGGDDDGAIAGGDDDGAIAGEEDEVVLEGVVAGDEAEVDASGETAVEEVSAGGSSERPPRKKKPKRPRLEGKPLRDELMKRERAEEKAVMDINTLFYRARAYKDIDELKEVWEESDLTECIRARGSPLKGYKAIIEEYKNDFLVAKKMEKPGQRPFKIRDLKVQTCGTLAWVTCIEDMRSPYKPQPKTVQLVTNVFSKTRQGWKMTRHHASDRDVSLRKGGASPTVSSLMGGDKGQSLGGSGAMDNSLLSHFVDENGAVTELTAKIFRVTDGELKAVDITELTGGDDDDDDDDDDEDDDDSDDQNTTRLPLLPDDLRKLIQDKVKGSSLGETHSIGPPIRLDANASAADIKKQVLAAVADHLKKVQGRGNRDAKDKSTVTSFEVNRASPSKSTDSTRRKSDSNGNSDADDSDDELDDDRISEELARNTVVALRKLSKAGKISEGEKRLLLADMIRDAFSGGPSMIEVAFQVLVESDAENEFDPNDCEEFVEQCKAYAGQLADDEKGRRWWNLWKFWIRG